MWSDVLARLAAITFGDCPDSYRGRNERVIVLRSLVNLPGGLKNQISIGLQH